MGLITEKPRSWRIHWRPVDTGEELAWFKATRRPGSAPQHGQEVVAAEDYDRAVEALRKLGELADCWILVDQGVPGDDPTSTKHVPGSKLDWMRAANSRAVMVRETVRVVIPLASLQEPLEAGYAASDPKSPGFHSVHSDLWDMREGK